jgi:hypothetical protein
MRAEGCRIKQALLSLLILVLIAGCRRESPEVVCVRHLQILDSCARSWALEENLAVTQFIAPSSLAGFLGTNLPICPSGTAQYAPFPLSSGPTCPNDASHTAKFLSTRPPLPKGLLPASQHQ